MIFGVDVSYPMVSLHSTLIQSVLPLYSQDEYVLLTFAIKNKKAGKLPTFSMLQKPFCCELYTSYNKGFGVRFDGLI